MHHWLLAALALAAAPAPVSAQPRDPAMDAAVHDLCHRQIVMLGEASHGDGATFAFKAGLIQRLVSQCGFSAVLFESSHYDFVELMRRLRERGREATAAMLSSAIGGIWNRYAELTPLIRFLIARAQAGRLTLGGIDDQLGSAGAFFSNDEMPIRLTARLPDDSRQRCRDLLHRRIYSGYPREAPANAEMRAGLLSCAEDMMRTAGNAEDAQLALNISRQADRDLDPDAMRNRRRDESMYRNLRWYAARLGPRARLIVWAQNAHVAYDASTSTAFPAGGSLGSYVHREYGRRAYALGFSAAGGAWRSVFSRADEPIAPAPRGTLEALAMTSSAGASVYRNNAWLARIGRVPGQPFFYHQTPAYWARVFDGMVVFRSERAPTRPTS